MSVVRVVQVAIDEVVRVVTMRDGFVTATGAVDVIERMGRTGVAAGAIRGIFGAHFEDVLVVVALVGVMEMAIVQVIDMAVVLDGSVAAARAVLMGMIGMNVMGHDFLAFRRGCAFSVAWASALKMSPETCWSASE